MVITLWNNTGKTISSLSSKAPSDAPTNVHKMSAMRRQAQSKIVMNVSKAPLGAARLTAHVHLPVHARAHAAGLKSTGYNWSFVSELPNGVNWKSAEQ